MMKNKILTAVTIVVSFVVGGVFTYIVISSPSNTTATGTVNYCGTTKCTNQVTVNEKGINDAIEKVYDAVVMIENYQNGSVVSTGTGFVYKVDEKYGYLLTNQHVVSRSDSIRITFSNDTTVDGVVAGSDAYMDLAVVKIAKENVTKVVSIGDSTKSVLGDRVFTVGSPLGYEYRGSVTSGILSGTDRLVTVNVADGNDTYVMKVLQTDAAMNPGNSGGPLLNINGEVIGINSLKLVQEEIEGMGFAIPIEFAMSHVETLEAGKEIERPVLGITLINASDTASLYQNGIKIDRDITTGVVVASVSKNSGASQAGLEKGDVIIAIDGEKVKDSAYLRYELYKHNVGDTIEITYLRNRKEQKAKATLTQSAS